MLNSNAPSATRSADFKLPAQLLPEIYSTRFIVYVFATLACDLTSITTATPTYTNEIQKLKVLNEGNLIHFQLNESNIAENSSRPKLQSCWVAFAL